MTVIAIQRTTDLYLLPLFTFNLFKIIELNESISSDCLNTLSKYFFEKDYKRFSLINSKNFVNLLKEHISNVETCKIKNFNQKDNNFAKETDNEDDKSEEFEIGNLKRNRNGKRV